MLESRKAIAFAIIIALICLIPGVTMAGQQAVEGENQSELATDECETVGETGYALCIGYMGFSIDGSGETIGPYGDLDSHLVVASRFFVPIRWGTLDLKLHSHGSNYQFHGELRNTLTRLALESKQFVRNSEHLALPPASDNTGSPLYTPDDQDPQDKYSVDHTDTKVIFKKRFATYPAHIKVSARKYVSEGKVQQVFLNENCTTKCHNISQTRKVKTTTDQVTVGGDAHAGRVDLSYSFKSTRFVDDMAAPVYGYDLLNTVPPRSGNAVHNQYPDVSSTEHMLNVSTNHTGRYSGFIGVGVGERKNEDSDLSEDYQNLIGRFLWRPSKFVSVILNGRQFYSQDSYPGSILETIKIADGSPVEYGTLKRQYRATVNYYPVKGIDLKGEYYRNNTRREDNSGWGLPDETTTEKLKIGTRVKPASDIKLKAEYSSSSTEDPAYSTESTDSRETTVGGQWIPMPILYLAANVKDLKDENTGNGRVNERLIVNTGITYTPVPPVSLALTYFRFEDDVTTDLTFDGPNPTIVTDNNVPYSALGEQIVFQASWQASPDLLVMGVYGILNAEGSFVVDQAAFQDVEDYSAVDTVQEESRLEMIYKLNEGWEISGKVSYLSYEDRSNILEDEKVNEVSTLVSKRW